MVINEIKFSDLEKQNIEGIVLLGCGGNLDEWVNGVTEVLCEEGISTSKKPSDVWNQVFLLTTTNGRRDLVLSGLQNVDIGKLAIWRIGFGDCSWVSDYLVNYRNQHGNIKTKSRLKNLR